MFRGGIDDQVDLHVLLIPDNDDRIERHPGNHLEPEHLVEFDRTVRVGDPDARVIDPLDANLCGHALSSLALT